MITKEQLKIRFGLRGEGGIRAKEYIHNGSWYNSAGERIGWGDLDVKDICNIQDNLQMGEALVILSEHKSYWPFVFPDNHSEVNIQGVDFNNPGQDFISKHACLIITHEMLYAWAEFSSDGGTFLIGDRTVTSVNREKMKEVISKAS